MTMGTRIAVMNCGVLQQFGTPQEIYQNPANLFVAGFIGSPNMNIWDTRIVSYNAQQFLTLGEARIPIDISGLPGEQLQEPLKAGIRPEHIELASKNEPGASGWKSVCWRIQGVKWLFFLLRPAYRILR